MVYRSTLFDLYAICSHFCGCRQVNSASSRATYFIWCLILVCVSACISIVSAILSHTYTMRNDRWSSYIQSLTNRSISGPPCTYVRMYCTCLSSPAQVPKMTLWRTTWWRTWTTPLCPREGGTSCWFGTDWPKGHVPLPGRSLSGACTSSTSRWEKVVQCVDGSTYIGRVDHHTWRIAQPHQLCLRLCYCITL